MPNAYQQSTQLLLSNRIIEGLACQRKWLTRLNDGRLNDELESIREDYRRLAGYFVNSVSDPQRSQLIGQLTLRSFDLIDEIYERMRVLTNKRQEFALIRSTNTQRFEQIRDVNGWNATNLFNYFWLKTNIDQVDFDFLTEILKTDRTDYKIVSIYGLWLNLMRRFSEKILLFFIEHSQGNDMVATQALTLTIFSVLYYGYRIPLYKSINERLELLSVDRQREVYAVLRLIALTERTHEAEDFMLEMQKRLYKEFNKQAPQSNPLVVLEEGEDIPQWLEKLSEKMSDSVESISQLAQDGVDVNYGNLKTYRQNNFFRHGMFNWFVPFTKENKEFFETYKLKNEDYFFQSLAPTSLCESDKYTIYTMYHQLSVYQNVNDEQMRLVGSQFAEFEKVDFEDFNVFARNIILTLYRFFKLNEWQYPDAFPQVIQQMENLDSFAWFGFVNKEAGELADLFVKSGLTRHALHLYNKLSSNALTASAYQKMGYCYEKEKDFDKALKSYQKADIIEPDQRWTLWHICMCYDNTGDPDKAAHTLERIMELFGEKNKYLLAYANLLERLKRYDDASRTYYKIVFLFGDSLETCRRLARLLLVNSQFEQACTYAQKLMQMDDLDNRDYVLAGHIFAINGQIQQSVDCYKKVRGERNDMVALFDSVMSELAGLCPTLNEKLSTEEQTLLLEIYYLGLEKK